MVRLAIDDDTSDDDEQMSGGVCNSSTRGARSLSSAIEAGNARSGKQRYYGKQRPTVLRRNGSSSSSSARRNLTLALYALSAPTTSMAQACIPLKTSTVCSAFNASSVSTNANLTALFPFLSDVSDTASFDSGLTTYISGDYASEKYNSLLGCSDFHADNTTNFYARYTASVLCNAIVQNSLSVCSLTGNAARPLCADSCAEYAQSEEDISASSNICGSTSNPNALNQIRADFTNCALPADSLAQSCILAAENQPNNCGFGPNLSGLCSYCAASSPNSTDSCCVFSETEKRCAGVRLPVIATSALRPITTTAFPSSTSPSSGSMTGASTNTSPTQSVGAGASSNNSNKGLTGGQIAGIVVGAILGALVLLGLLILGCVCLKRHRDSSPPTSVFNQPVTSQRQRGPQMSYSDGTRDGGAGGAGGGMSALPGGARVARMAALEDGGDPSYSSAIGGGMGAAYNRRKSVSNSSPSSTNPSTRDLTTGGTGAAGGAAPPPKRGGSLSSSSQLAAIAAAAGAAGATAGRYHGSGGNGMDSTTSPSSNEYTSPESQPSSGGGGLSGSAGSGVGMGGNNIEHSSEQLAFFKDYYSTDDIHTGELVSTLWAYEPRAPDEFQLERGDMIKVLGIWDDGWATGVRVRLKAEDWRAPGSVARDSGLSSNQQQQRERDMLPRSTHGPDGEGEVKAFPLVCVCLPQHWRKTIEGESTEGTSGVTGTGGIAD